MKRQVYTEWIGIAEAASRSSHHRQVGPDFICWYTQFNAYGIIYSSPQRKGTYPTHTKTRKSEIRRICLQLFEGTIIMCEKLGQQFEDGVINNTI
jgi:hypothetical protein